MAINATITTNNTRREAVLGRMTVRDRGVLKKALTLAVLVMIAVLPITGLISAADAGHSPHVETPHLDYHKTLYSPPHLPHTTDNLLEGWEKYPRVLFM